MAKITRHHPMGAFVDGGLAQARLALVTDTALRLAAYRDSYATLAALPNGAAALAERARDAENDVRVLLRCGLDTLNDYYDSGEAATAIATLRDANLGLSLRPDDILSQAVAVFREQKVELHPQFLTELRAAFGKLDLKATVGDSTIVAESGGDRHEFSFDRRPGDLGRVAASTFFARVGDRVRLVTSAAADPDLHHDAPIASAAGTGVDAYGSAIAALAFARDFMAQHSAVTAYFGRPHVLAHGPIGVIIAIIVGVGAIVGSAVATGICIASGEKNTAACAVGIGLFLLAGIALLVGHGKATKEPIMVTIGGDGTSMPV